MEFGVFDNYAVNILRPRNNKSDETELNRRWYKFKDSNESILHNALSNVI